MGIADVLDRARAVGESLQIGPARGRAGELTLPIEARVRLPYSPNLEGGHLFVPGLVAIILQLVLLFRTSFAIVKERELGSLFIVTVLGLGLLISTIARTQLEALQFLFLIMRPSVLLSGFMFRAPRCPGSFTRSASRCP